MAAHRSAEALAARDRAADDPVLRSQLQMVWLLVAGRALAEVAAVTGSGARWVREVVRRDNEAGPDGLGDRRHGNRGGEPRLDAAGRAALTAALEKPPPADGLWTAAKVTAWIAARTGRAGGAAARLARPPAHRAQPPGAKAAARAGGGRSGRSTEAPAPRLICSKTLSDTVAAARARSPERPVEVWACDEHQAGLKPVRRRVWAPRGRGPIATVHPRSAWLDLDGFVRPTGGAVAWFLCTAANTAVFAAVLARVAAAVGAGTAKTVILVLDRAGWHGGGRLAVPEGVRLVVLLPYRPALQPAERRWTLARAPVPTGPSPAWPSSTKRSPRAASPSAASPRSSRPIPASVGRPKPPKSTEQPELV